MDLGRISVDIDQAPVLSHERDAFPQLLREFARASFSPRGESKAPGVEILRRPVEASGYGELAQSLRGPKYGSTREGRPRKPRAGEYVAEAGKLVVKELQ